MVIKPLKKKTYLFIIGYFLLILAVVIFLNVKTHFHYKDSNKINSVDALDSTFIEQSESSIRGVIRIEDKGYLSTSAELIYNPQNFHGWENNGPVVSFTKHKYIQKLNDLPFPYLIYKKVNNDTLIIRKDSFYIYFKIDKLE